MAVEQEHMGTSFNLGQRFLHGIGIEKNVPEAVRLFRYAAKYGSEEAKKTDRIRRNGINRPIITRSTARTEHNFLSRSRLQFLL